MSRLIDADALIKDLSKEWNVLDELEFANKAMWKVIENAPTIEERKKGKWIRTRTMEHDGELYCNQCEQEHPEQKIIWNFCPRCGARMEVEDDERA